MGKYDNLPNGFVHWFLNVKDVQNTEMLCISIEPMWVSHFVFMPTNLIYWGHSITWLE